MENVKTTCTPDAQADTNSPTYTQPIPGNDQVTPFNGHSTDYQKVKLPMPREFNGKKYYGLADVAKITVTNQRKRRLL